MLIRQSAAAATSAAGAASALSLSSTIRNSRSAGVVFARAVATRQLRSLSAARPWRALPGSPCRDSARGDVFRSMRQRRFLASQAQRVRDYYEVLGVGRSASQSDIKQAFYKLAKALHPDSGGDKEKFAEVNAAYQTLGDEKKRRIYDQFGHEGVQAADQGMDPSQNPFTGAGGFGGAQGFPGGFAGFGGSSGGGGFGGFSNANAEDFLRDVSDFFSGGAAGGASRGGFAGAVRDGAVRGEDLQTTLVLEFMDAAKGAERTLSVPAEVECDACSGSGRTKDTSVTNCRQCRGTGLETFTRGFFIQQSTCSRCGGSGKIIKNPCVKCSGDGHTRGRRTVTVSIPAGVDSGDSLRVASKGNAGTRGGSAGNLYVKVRVKEDAFFHRSGSDIHVVAPITFSQAALGGTVKVRTLEGEEEVKIASGTQPDDQVTLRNMGLPSVNAKQQIRGRPLRGSQYVHLKVVVPTQLNEEQRELFKKLSTLEDVHGSVHSCPESLLRRFGNFLRTVTGKNRTAM